MTIAPGLCDCYSMLGRKHLETMAYRGGPLRGIKVSITRNSGSTFYKNYRVLVFNSK